MLLTKEQVLEATSVDPDALPGQTVDQSKRMQDLEPFSSLMATMVKRVQPFERYWRPWILQIAHSSVKDFLLSESSRPEPFPRSQFVDETAKAPVVATCLGYLGHISAAKTPRLSGTSFAEYSHSTRAGIPRSNQDVERQAYNSILKFLIRNG